MQEQAGFWLSPQQKVAWRIEQEALAHSARSACLISLACRAEAERLHAALREVVSRHEALRTVFRRQAGMKMPFQVVTDSAEIQWEVKRAAGQEDIQSLFASEQNRPFDLEASPLRAVFVEISAENFALILSVPSLCADARSLQVIARELAAFYAGTGQSLPEAFRHLQFAQWQADLLESDDQDARNGRAFWEKQLTNSSGAPALPQDAKSTERFQPESISVKLSGSIASTLLARSDVSGVLLAAWQCFLYRLSGQNAFTIGLVAENREYEELQNAVGCFGRNLPLNVRIENTFAFSDVLRRMNESVHDAVAVQEYFVPEAIGLDGELVSFACTDLEKLQQGLVLERVAVRSEYAKLKLEVVKRGAGPGQAAQSAQGAAQTSSAELELIFHYDGSRFSRAAVEKIAGYYQNLLTAAMANAATLVAKLPLLAESERSQLLIEWNETAAAYPQDKCLHQLFEEQAAAHPERVAVRTASDALTYGELNERANQLAHYLRKQGVGPDERVGLAVERSPRMMLAVLAIMKAGGAYVPINADNPAARTKQQLAGAKALITESKFAAQMPEFAGTTLVLDRENDAQRWANEPKTNPAPNTTPENLVYLIYTSGSTGVPKGVAVRHRNLVNYADFIARKLRLSEHRDGLQFATVSTLGADLGNTCIYPALISGGTLHVLPHEVATDPQQFALYTGKYPVDVLKIVPSHLAALLQSSSDEAKKILPRKYLITGGEALTPKLLEKIAALHPACEILNHYGPTETTVGSLTLELKSYDWKNAGLATIPIGRPIQNTQVYVLDQNLAPAPVGVTGELYIAGAGVTAGYLGQAEKTAERFVQNPFANQGGSEFRKTLMYRTGDLARYGADGNIEFLGRGDDQVKIRGFRIELGEIESVLAQHPAVKQAVVLARAYASNAATGVALSAPTPGGPSLPSIGFAGDDKRLLAYVVLHREAATNGHGAVTAETLRQHLQQHVPDYMVPQAVVLLPKLPLNANGKLDRQALPEPEQAAAQKVYVAPRTATEQAIATIWAEVLRRDAAKIGADDNFFDLGGHSLLATQVVSRLRQEFQVEIPMRIIFDQPSVSGLALAVEKAQPLAAETEEIGLSAVPREAYRESQ